MHEEGDAAEIQSLCREACGEELSLADARDIARRLIDLYDLLLRPVQADRSSESVCPRHKNQSRKLRVS